jgi:hypothetical protein
MSDDSPSIGPNPPVTSWPEYDQLADAVDAYLGHDPDDPAWRDIWRALGAIMGEYQRQAFIDAFGLAEPAEKPCISRLITGEDCPHGPLMDTPNRPPHSPPADDHSTLWLDETGEPALYGMHVYPGNIERLDSDAPPYNQWFDLFQFASEWGLGVSILPTSWYALGSTVHVVFYPPERFRSPAGES